MLIVESRLILFSSVLLIAAGALVLWMRHNNTADPVEYINTDEDVEFLINEDTNLRDHERRIDDDRDFPLLDDNGAMVAFDRRTDQSAKKD
jgi:hypothetical protein